MMLSFSLIFVIDPSANLGVVIAPSTNLGVVTF